MGGKLMDRELKDTLKGKNIGLITEPRCKICKSPLRDRVDRLAAAGFGGAATADEIMGLDPTLSTNRDTLRKNIERHISEHLRIKDAAIRQILENRAKEAGIILEEYQGRLVSDTAFLDLMVAQATDQVTDPNAKVYYKDALEAVRIKKDMEQSNFAAKLETMERQVWAISQAIKDVVPDGLYLELITRAKELFDSSVIDLPAPPKKEEIKSLTS